MKNALYYSTDGGVASSFNRILNRGNFALLEVQSYEQAKKELLTSEYQICIARYQTAASVQYELLNFVKDHNIPTKVIVLVTSGTVEDTVRLMKAGANDVVISDRIDDQLARALLHKIEDKGQPLNKSDSPKSNSLQKVGHIFIGQSPAMNEVKTAVNLVARSPTAVLITGESGTGKEVVARMIHLDSDRADKPFIALNCAALPKDVIENELFGHEKGAFTGALDRKAGCFELANHGTLFFDEIAEMSPDTQAKLLRAIETKTFRRLGAGEEIHVDVRTVAATNRKMSEALETGEFRKDLYYRFSVIEIDIPPLREHREDIPLLVNHFLSTMSEQYRRPLQRFSDECLEILMLYNWPGNIRELRNVVERSVVTCKEKVITQKILPAHITLMKNGGSSITLPIGISSREAERRFILQTLAEAGNNKTKAAQILGLSRKTLHNKLREFEVQ